MRETEFHGIKDHAENNDFDGRWHQIERRTAALVRPRAAQVVPRLALLDMHLERSLALRLVRFYKSHHYEEGGD